MDVTWQESVALAEELAKNEAVIQRGLDTFLEVGEALLRIRDGRQYRAKYLTFESYCRERWGFSVAQGKRLVAAAEVVNALAPTGAVPASESVARELAPLRSDSEQLRETWTEAIERHGPTPTASQVRETREARHLSVVPESTGRARPAPAKDKDLPSPRKMLELLEEVLKVATRREVVPLARAVAAFFRRTPPDPQVEIVCPICDRPYDINNDGPGTDVTGRDYQERGDLRCSGNGAAGGSTIPSG